jgi:hypothetical protein
MGFQWYPFSTNQATVTGTATLIVAANSARSGIVITNTDATNVVYLIENINGSTSTGHYLPAGSSIGFSTTLAIYGITNGPSVVVTWLQTQ